MNQIKEVMHVFKWAETEEEEGEEEEVQKLTCFQYI